MDKQSARRIEDLPVEAEQAGAVKGGIIVQRGVVDPNEKSYFDPNVKSVIDPNDLSRIDPYK
jgi:hypothetical protein